MKFVLKKNVLKTKTNLHFVHQKNHKKEKKKKRNEQCGLYTINWVSFLTMCVCVCVCFFFLISGTPIFNYQLMLDFCLNDTICQNRKNVSIFAWVSI